MDILTGLSSITSAVEIVKELNEVDKEFKKADLKLKIAELAENLTKARFSLSEAQEEIAKKDSEIERLKLAFQHSAEYVEKDGYKFEKDAYGNPKGHPLCPRCLTKDGFPILTVRGAKWFVSICPQCKQDYYYVSIPACEQNERNKAQRSQLSAASVGSRFRR